MEQKVIGKNIAKFRTERGLTQSQLAEFLFITPQTVSKWETEQEYYKLQGLKTHLFVQNSL